MSNTRVVTFGEIMGRMSTESMMTAVRHEKPEPPSPVRMTGARRKTAAKP